MNSKLILAESVTIVALLCAIAILPSLATEASNNTHTIAHRANSSSLSIPSNNQRPPTNPSNTTYITPIQPVRQASNVSSTFGNAPDGSIFRPALLSSLLARRTSKRPSIEKEASESSPIKFGASDQEDEEEEVTQTIELPLQPQPSMDDTDDSNNNASPEDDDDSESGSSLVLPSGNRFEQSDQPTSKQRKSFGQTNAQTLKMLLASNQNRKQRMRSHPRFVSTNLKPEASLTLSNTEMSSILNDREAPEGYRSRELAGEGVHVGEELSQLGAAASSSVYPSQGLESSPFDVASFGHSSGSLPYHAEPGMSNPMAFGGHRLINAESAGGFSHRFGALDDERLMQQPNGFNELNYNNHVHQNGLMGAGSADPSAYAYSSGLLRASSGGGEFGNAHTSGFYGHHDHAFARGFNSRPSLDRDASEIIGGGGGGSSFDSYDTQRSSGFDPYAQNSARLHHMATSHEPNQYNAPFSPSSFRGEESSGPQYHQHYPMSDEAALAEHAYGAPIGANSLQQRSGHTDSSGEMIGPLSPIVPTADELPDSLVAASNGGRDHFLRLPQDKSVGVANGEPRSRAPVSFGRRSNRVDDPSLQAANSKPSYDEDETTTITTDDQTAADEQGADMDETLANNGREQPEQRINLARLVRPSVEFERVGSAGYLGPTKLSGPQQVRDSQRKKLVKKTLTIDSRELGASYQDPAENPAHRGKFIID